MWLKVLLSTVSLLWAGMILGIILASTVKFRAPGLTKAIGLEVGRTIFKVFHKAQIFLLLLIIVIALLSALSFKFWMLVIFLSLVFLIQEVFLLPKLNQRVTQIITGQQLSKSYLHGIYGIMEVAKIFLLLYLFVSIYLL